MQKVSLILASFLRPQLLNLGLLSITKYITPFSLEIIVVNDGIDDGTKEICDSYRDRLDIKYAFTGQRNSQEIQIRNPAKPLNVGIKQSTGEIIVLSCPEMYHIDDCLNKISQPLFNKHKYLTTPRLLYFDNTNEFTSDINNGHPADLKKCEVHDEASQMPFLMGIWKDEVINIGGYDEDFNDGYGGEDNDLVDRLQLNGCSYHRVDTNVVHLYHGIRCDSYAHWENPKWIYSHELITAKKGTIIRNVGKEWGIINE